MAAAVLLTCEHRSSCNR